MGKRKKEREFNIVYNVPHIHNTEELQLYLKPKYTLKDVLQSVEIYHEVLSALINTIRGCYTIYECRTYPIKWRFTPADKRYHTMEFRNFVTNMILWRPFVELNELNIMDDSYVMTDFHKDIPNLNDYIDIKIIETLRNYHVAPTTINFDVAEVLHNLILLDIDFGLILNLNFTLKTFIDWYEKHPTLRDIMESKFPETLRPHEIEAKLSRLETEEIEYLKGLPEDPIGIIMRTGSGIKPKQLAEFSISEGLKPSIEGKTVPKSVENSTLIGGLNKPSYLMIGAMGSRKSLVANKRWMGTAGYFAKEVAELTGTVQMSTEVSMCDTKKLACYEIKTKKHLKKMVGKFFKESLTDDDYKVVTLDMTHLVGKKIYVRSAATCALPNNHVCTRCIGIQASASFDIPKGLSIYLSEETTKDLEQNILSTNALCLITVMYLENLSNCGNVLLGLGY